MMDLKVRHYVPGADSGLWDSFVSKARNATFLHLRQYMDYHADRFTDESLMIEDNGRLVAVMPGCRMDGDTFCSHAGLTFGGLLLSDEMTQEPVLEAFSLINSMLSAEGLRRVIYKPVPHIYHRLPAEEDLYALFKVCGAELASRAPSTTVVCAERLPLARGRKCALRKALKAGVEVGLSDDFEGFWQILSDNLAQKHNAVPVHSLSEIMLLRARFPERIKLFVAKLHGEMVAGSVVYLFDRVAHTQYISASPRGKEVGALDPLLNYIIDTHTSYRYFDFGISTERGGTILNSGLIRQKEGFGARVTCQDSYSWTL